MAFQWTNNGGGWVDVARNIQGLADAQQMARIRDQQAQIAQAEAERARRAGAIKQTADELALRGQILAPVERPDEYGKALGMIRDMGLPTSDLPEDQRSTAWQPFAQPKEMRVAPAWLGEKWKPAPLLTQTPEQRLPSGTMSESQIAPEEIATSVQRAAQKGLPISLQEKLQEAQIGREIQLANLRRNLDKDALSREWMAFQREAKTQGMNDAETQREFTRYMQERGFQLDVAKFAQQTKADERKAAEGKTPNEGQSKAALFGGQVNEGFRELEDLMAAGFNPTSAYNAAGVRFAGTLANPLVSENAQLWKQSVDRIANAALRFESGAAIADQEAARKIRETIPGYGDSPAVVRSKMRTIKKIIEGLEVAAGPARGAVRGAQLPTEEQWKAAWSSAKPGDVVMGPDGKKYRKGGR